MIYLDNAATTKPLDTVVTAMTSALRDEWANPSSSHRPGLAARAVVETARAAVADYCGLDPQGVIFTSGGTEANHLAALGLPLRSGTTRIVTTVAEHPSLGRALASRRDAEVIAIPLTRQGGIDLDQLEQRLDSSVGLVAMFDGHNETGAKNPIESIVERVRRRSPRALIHVDAVQSFGKLGRPGFALGVDSAAVSAHKIHGPKGVGALLLRTRTRLAPLQLGGGQESDRRSGTENVPGIAGFGAAVAALATPSAPFAAIAAMRERLVRELTARIPGSRVLGEGGPTLPHIVAIVLPGVRSEVVLHHLEQQGIVASAGAACHAGSHQLSAALRAIGLTDDEIRATLRLSLARTTTETEVHAVIEALPTVVRRLQMLERGA